MGHMFFSHDVLSLDFTPKVIFLISVPVLILQIIYIALKIRKLLFMLHSSLCIEDSKMNKGTELR